ncbi:MAG: hypothetical protein AAGA11_01745 [Pseudomonadota bacterium]
MSDASHLYTPTQRSQRSADFAGDQKSVMNWLRDLRELAPSLRVRSFKLGLQRSNRSQSASGKRIQVLEWLRPECHHAQQVLRRSWQGQDIPLSADAERAWQDQLALLTELGFGYKIALSDDLADPKLTTAARAHACVRTLDVLHQQLLIARETYRSAPPKLLKDAYSLYAVAERHGFVDTPVADNLLRTGETRTVSQLFKMLLLAHSVDANALPTTALIGLNRRLPSWVDRVTLRVEHPGTRSRALAFDLADDAPPQAAPFRARAGRATVRWLVMDALAQDLESQRASGDFDPALLPLYRLCKGRQDRREARAFRNDAVNVVLGLNDVHASVLRDLDGSGDGDWAMRDLSPSGLGLNKTSASPTGLHVGALAAVRRPHADDNGIWRVGIVQWLRQHADEHYQCGLQLLSTEARAVYATYRVDTGAILRTECMLIPAAHGNTSPCLVLPPRRFKTGQALTLLSDAAPSTHWRLKAMLRNTSSVSVFSLVPTER